MRAWLLAAAIVIASSPSSFAVVRLSLPGECADRDALQNMAYDARLEAIQFYYKGFIQNLTDKTRQTCFEAHILKDDSFAIINKTRALIETDCLPIDVAARMAAGAVCP